MLNWSIPLCAGKLSLRCPVNIFTAVLGWVVWKLLTSFQISYEDFKLELSKVYGTSPQSPNEKPLSMSNGQRSHDTNASEHPDGYDTVSLTESGNVEPTASIPKDKRPRALSKPGKAVQQQVFHSGPIPPAFRIPDFRWSPMHQRLLSDLLFSIETDVQAWRRYATFCDCTFVACPILWANFKSCISQGEIQ